MGSEPKSGEAAWGCQYRPGGAPALQTAPNAQRREIWACATCSYIGGGVWELVVHLMSGSQMGEPSLVFASESLHRENGRASRLIAKAPQPRPSDLRSCKAARRETQGRA